MMLGADDVVLLGGFSIGKALRKTGSAVKSAAKVTVKVAAAPAKAVVTAVPVAARMTKNVAVDAAKGTGHVVATAGRAVGHGVMELKRASERAAKKIVRGIVLKNLRGEDIETGMLLGADASTKTAVKVVVVPLATAAVLASAVAAPAAPLVPVMVPPIIDEVYSTVKKKMDSGKTLQQAVDEAEAEGPPPFYKTPIGVAVIGGSAFFAVLALARRNRRS